ncbi:DNA repair protein RecN [Pajaroellobacter abortibovis]|uniref:DNA repair protein RecN n=1 Tax=Pajaroellobacter abortibovis TaxID=1882918 RepID=A0A1L6MX69_9BACT|nr:DNA repair protein RecN [Pajaroellobacter abortibovis]APS00036.1 DNA repair protein RecN [Pajaroellobacter abortibovis]
MLLQLIIRDFVLIEYLVLEFHPAFNVITGETGAGKSIIIGALELIRGGRFRSNIVRSGAQAAEVEALFTVEPNSSITEQLREAGIPLDEEIVIRRIISKEGRSKAYLNGRMITLFQLSEIGSQLCHIASQHESITLTNPSTHIEYLDAFGKLQTLREDLAFQVDSLNAVFHKMKCIQEAEARRNEQQGKLIVELQDIQRLRFQSGEQQQLEQERKKLKNANKLSEVTQLTLDRLYEKENAICDELTHLGTILQQAGSIDPDLLSLASTIENARSELIEVVHSIRRYQQMIEINSMSLEDIEERLFSIHQIARKYGLQPDQFVERQLFLEQELQDLSQANDKLVELKHQQEELYKKAEETARILSNKRGSLTNQLAHSITQELQQLGMTKAQFLIDIHPIKAGSEDPWLIDGAKLTRAGIDQVEFLIAPNQGSEPRPLRQIASGGELSRSLLALKRILIMEETPVLHVFDEIDTGIGGGIAEKLGRAIADISFYNQIICITHLPQIASFADAHFMVTKKEKENATITHVERLSESRRIEELARMIGGTKITEATRTTAEEMLDRSRNQGSERWKGKKA